MKKAFITSGPGHVHSLAIAFAACKIEIFIKVILDPLDTGVKVFRIISIESQPQNAEFCRF